MNGVCGNLVPGFVLILQHPRFVQSFVEFTPSKTAKSTPVKCNLIATTTITAHQILYAPRLGNHAHHSRISNPINLISALEITPSTPSTQSDPPSSKLAILGIS
jgi:hypothetical protein